MNFEFKPGAKRRLALTAIVVGCWCLLRYIPVPLLNHEELGQVPEYIDISIQSLGITSFLVGYVFVELFSLFLPPLKQWRKQGRPGRAKLFKTGLVVTLFFAAVGSWGTLNSILQLGVYQPNLFQASSSLVFRLVGTFTLTAMLYLTLWSTIWVSKNGVPHGISVYLLFVAMLSQAEVFLAPDPLFYTKHPASFVLLVNAVVLCLFVGLIIWVETWSFAVTPSKGKGLPLPLKPTMAGIMPAVWGLGVLKLHSLMQSYFSQEPLIIDRNLVSYVIVPVVIIGFSFLLAHLFYRPSKIMALAGWDPQEARPPLMRIAPAIGALYLCILVYLPDLLSNLIDIPLRIDGIELLLIVAIIMDLGRELGKCDGDPYVEIAEFHSVPKADLARLLLEKENIPSVIRGYQHRGLLHFFGPYIEMKLMVPEQQHGLARKVLDRLAFAELAPSPERSN